MADFLMPALGADMETGQVVQWLVQAGARVKPGDVVAAVSRCICRCMRSRSARKSPGNRVRYMRSSFDGSVGAGPPGALLGRNRGCADGFKSP